MVTESVHFKSIDGAELRMVVSGIFLQGSFHFVGQVQALLGGVVVLVHSCKDFSSLAQ